MGSAERLKIDVLLLLYSRPDGVPLDELQAEFLNFHGCHFDPFACGYHSLNSLLEDMDGTVHLCEHPSPRLRASVAGSPAYSGPSRSQKPRPTLPAILPQYLLAFLGPSLLHQPSWAGLVPPRHPPLSFGAPEAYTRASFAACHPPRFPAAPGGVSEAPPTLGSPSGQIVGWPRLRTRPQALNPGLAPQSSNGANVTDPKQKTLTYSQAVQQGAAGGRRGREGGVREGWRGDYNLQSRSGTSLNLNGPRNLSTLSNLPQESLEGWKEKASTVQKGPQSSSPPDPGRGEVLENPGGVREKILELLDRMPDGMSFFELRRSCAEICGRSTFTGDCPNLKTWLGTVGIEVSVLGLGVQARIHPGDVSGRKHLSDAA